MRPKTSDEIKIMREGGKRLGTILQKLSKQITAGVSGKDISALAAVEIDKAGLQPVLLGYQGFNDVICVSVNDAIVHGLPNEEPIKVGDVVKLDLTVGHKSLIVDSAVTVIVGQGSADAKRLRDGTHQALMTGIDAIKGEGTRVGDISSAVQAVLDKHKLGVIRDLVGHGVGYAIHEDPNIPNYGLKGTGPILMSGMTIAVEPMAALGDWHISVAKDGWTILMTDGSLGAHFEHTILITDDGAEILTQA
jgi:methionyl aminopeptidase